MSAGRLFTGGHAGRGRGTRRPRGRVCDVTAAPGRRPGCRPALPSRRFRDDGRALYPLCPARQPLATQDCVRTWAVAGVTWDLDFLNFIRTFAIAGDQWLPCWTVAAASLSVPVCVGCVVCKRSGAAPRYSLTSSVLMHLVQDALGGRSGSHQSEPSDVTDTNA